LIIGTIRACLISRQNTFGHRIPLSTYTTLEKVQTQIIQIDAIIITGLFVVLAIAFQVPSLPSIQDPSLSIDVKSFIIGITVSTSFPFVVSAMFMSIFGFGPTVWTDPTTKIKPNVPLWQAKMALAFMIFGSCGLGDLIIGVTSLKEDIQKLFLDFWFLTRPKRSLYVVMLACTGRICTNQLFIIVRF